MNRIVRISSVSLALFAATSAFAESPFYTIEPAAVRTTVTAPAAAREIVRGVVNDYVQPAAQPVTSGRTRAEVRAETIAALASGELRVQPGSEDAYYPLHAAATSRAVAPQRLAQSSR